MVITLKNRKQVISNCKGMKLNKATSKRYVKQIVKGGGITIMSEELGAPPLLLVCKFLPTSCCFYLEPPTLFPKC